MYVSSSFSRFSPLNHHIFIELMFKTCMYDDYTSFSLNLDGFLGGVIMDFVFFYEGLCFIINS